MGRTSNQIKDKDDRYVRVSMMIAIGSIICIILLSMRMNSIEQDANQGLVLAQKALADLQIVSDVDTRLDIIEGDTRVLDGQILALKMIQFDMWLDGLNDTAKGRIGNYEFIHDGYFNCVRDFGYPTNINIVRNLWGDPEPLPAKAAIITYDNHYMTYRSDGIIQCYPNPLLKNDSSARPCESFCEVVE